MWHHSRGNTAGQRRTSNETNTVPSPASTPVGETDNKHNLEVKGTADYMVENAMDTRRQSENTG